MDNTPYRKKLKPFLVAKLSQATAIVEAELSFYVNIQYFPPPHESFF